MKLWHTDRPTVQPTDRHSETDRYGHREVSLPMNKIFRWRERREKVEDGERYIYIYIYIYKYIEKQQERK